MDRSCRIDGGVSKDTERRFAIVIYNLFYFLREKCKLFYEESINYKSDVGTELTVEAIFNREKRVAFGCYKWVRN